MNMTKQEYALVNFVRGLCFEDLLDATNGIYNEKEKAETMVLKQSAKGNQINAEGFKARAYSLNRLAELLGNANADYYAHIHPEESQPGVTKMIETNADEVIYLFEIMEKYGVTCSLELNASESPNPLYGTSQATVKTEYIEGGIEGDTVVVYLGEGEFGFDLKNHSFSKHISECQIDICIASDNYAAWFSSSVIDLEGIKEAVNFKPLEKNDTEYNLDRDKPEFLGEIDGLIHHLAMKGSVIKELDSSILGKYRIVVGQDV